MTESDVTAAQCRRTMSKLPVSAVVQMASIEAPANGAEFSVGNNDIFRCLPQEFDAPGVCAACATIFPSHARVFTRAEPPKVCSSCTSGLADVHFQCVLVSCANLRLSELY